MIHTLHVLQLVRPAELCAGRFLLVATVNRYTAAAEALAALLAAAIGAAVAAIIREIKR